MLRTRPGILVMLLATAPPAAAAPLPRQAIEGLAFFAVLFALLIYALLMRVRDARFPPEEQARRRQRRLPFIMGVFIANVAYVAFRSFAS